MSSGGVHACLNGNPATQRGALSMAEPVQTIRPPLPYQEPEGCDRTHLEEKALSLVLHMEMSMGCEVLHEERHASCQADRTKERAYVPDGDECFLHRRAVPGRPAPAFRGAPDQDTLSQEIPLSCLVQDTGGMSPAVSRLLTEIVQHLRLPCLPCLQICLCLDHRELPPFLEPPLRVRPSDTAAPLALRESARGTTSSGGLD
jgi:hypothetical protein